VVLFVAGLTLVSLVHLAAPELVLSAASVNLHRGQPARVVIKLVDATSIGWMERDGHEGRVVAAVRLGRKPWVETDIGKLAGQSRMMFLDDEWDIVFADYNHDGRPDFNLGQQCGSNNNCYWLFSIEKSGHVALLPLPKSGVHPGFLWMQGDDAYSTGSIELTPDGIAASGYDPAGGGFRIRYRWDSVSHAFVIVERTGGEYPDDHKHAP
jgi:hypothetical protein